MEVDLEFLRRTVREVHPALASDEASAAFDIRVNQLLDRLDAPMTRMDVALAAAQVLHCLPEPDAHTTVVEYPLAGPVLPVRLRWVSDGLVVVQAAPGTPLRPYDVVVSLGGFAPEQLLDGLRSFISAANDGWVRAQGEYLIHQPSVLEKLGAVAEDGTVPVIVRRRSAGAAVSGGSPAQEDELAVSVRFVSSGGTALGPKEPPRPWFGWWVEPRHSPGLFWLDSCLDTPEYRSAVDDFFEAVHAAQVQKVAIDLRRNPGGDSIVTDAFLQYLPADALRGHRSEIRFSPQANAQRGYRGPGDPRAYRPDTPTSQAPPPEFTFSGDLYVLTSEHTFSGGVWIATALSDNGLAQVVGEPTGEAPSGYGDILYFTLPASGLRFAVSHKRFIRPAPERDPANALVPDHLVPTTVEDVRQRRDPQLEWVRAVMPTSR